MSELQAVRGVSRYAYGRTKGWLARVYRTVGGGEQQAVRRLFSDGVHGGYQAAYDAAEAWVIATRESAPEARPTKRVAGYGYVRRALRKYRTASGEVRVYEAFEANVWDHEGKPSSTAWSIERHGEERAKAACEAWLAVKRSSLSPQLDRCG